jgi:hypothetical protein
MRGGRIQAAILAGILVALLSVNVLVWQVWQAQQSATVELSLAVARLSIMGDQLTLIEQHLQHPHYPQSGPTLLLSREMNNR